MNQGVTEIESLFILQTSEDLSEFVQEYVQNLIGSFIIMYDFFPNTIVFESNQTTSLVFALPFGGHKSDVLDKHDHLRVFAMQRRGAEVHVDDWSLVLVECPL
jgi:hypothetical protein